MYRRTTANKQQTDTMTKILRIKYIDGKRTFTLTDKDPLHEHKVLMEKAYTAFMEISAKRGRQKRALEILERITDSAWSAFSDGFHDICFEGAKVTIWNGMTRDELKKSINLTMIKVSNRR